MNHPVLAAVVPPWQATLNLSERTLIYYFLVIAGLALLAMLLRTAIGIKEVSAKYRPSIFAGIGVVAIAFVSYVVLAIKFDVGYTQQGDLFVPNGNAIWSWAPRYMDWSITVPLLIVELIGVSALTGLAARRMRVIGVASAILMIFTGYLGGVVIDDGSSMTALLWWGIISSVFFAVLYGVVIRTVMKSMPSLPGAARPTFRNAGILLLVIWFAYPIVFGFQGWTSGGASATALQVTLSAADIIAKVGFGLMIHKVAKLRTAADVAAGIDIHPETIWADQNKQADAVAPASIHLEHADHEQLAGQRLQ
ncbi:bacteriorhodopsin [Amnibacterium endophyticum]|uniref:Bacteriorhodopsin n=1 Tax=Amnibacterium endophyticum TaxID=2109337 RepID=A0ABW4LEU0_9MICO